MELETKRKDLQLSSRKTPKSFKVEIPQGSSNKLLDEKSKKQDIEERNARREYIFKILLGGMAVVISISIYLLLTTVYTTVFPTKAAAACCALSFLASIFWSVHILPLEITSVLLIPVVILSNIMVPEQTGMSGWVAGCINIMQILASPVVLLLMGSCLLSVYFQCNGGEQLVLPYLIDGSNIYSSLFRSMLLSVVLSSMMSNITAPIIIMSILQNRSKPPTPGIIMGVAMGSNIGGMLLPISSPQSILGSTIMGVSWSKWVWISIPTASVCFVFVYSLILAYFPKPQQEKESTLVVGEPENSFMLMFVTALCIVCWALPSLYSGLKWIYALPVCGLLLTKSAKTAFNRKTLEIIAIAVAGTAIGQGIKSTKMIEGMISGLIISSKEHSFLSLLVVSSFVMLTLSCIVCHTVSAIVLLPIFEKIGMLVGRHKLIVGISTLACSCGMAFPASGFPNILASSFKLPNGKRLVGTKDFILIGTVSTLACWVFILTVSLLFMTMANF
ncbi:phosphate transporter [Nematocida ausubeli]|nr:phosphate transporter [Nematocida ausubeli]